MHDRFDSGLFPKAVAPELVSLRWISLALPLSNFMLAMLLRVFRGYLFVLSYLFVNKITPCTLDSSMADREPRITSQRGSRDAANPG
jgi:hypothetical protein